MMPNLHQRVYNSGCIQNYWNWFSVTFHNHLCLLRLKSLIKIAWLGRIAIGKFYQKFQVIVIWLYLMTTQLTHVEPSLTANSDNVYKGRKHVHESKMWQPLGWFPWLSRTCTNRAETGKQRNDEMLQRRETNRGTLTDMSGTNIPSSVNSGTYRARITSNEPCLISFIWSSWHSSLKPTNTSNTHYWYACCKLQAFLIVSQRECLYICEYVWPHLCGKLSLKLVEIAGSFLLGTYRKVPKGRWTVMLPVMW